MQGACCFPKVADAPRFAKGCLAPPATNNTVPCCFTCVPLATSQSAADAQPELQQAVHTAALHLAAHIPQGELWLAVLWQLRQGGVHAFNHCLLVLPGLQHKVWVLSPRSTPSGFKGKGTPLWLYRQDELSKKRVACPILQTALREERNCLFARTLLPPCFLPFPLLPHPLPLALPLPPSPLT